MIYFEKTIAKYQVYLADSSRLSSLLTTRRFQKDIERIFDRLNKGIPSNDFTQVRRNLERLEQVEVSIHLCGKVKMRKLNNEYRQKDYATDVLSFPLQEGFREKNSSDIVGVAHLGDIFICREVALVQAKEFNLTYREEVLHLLVHGLLHLLGFDHEESDQEELIQESLEKAWLELNE